MRDPGQPSASEHKEHMTTHRPCRSWCKFSVIGRGVESPRHVSMDFWHFGEKESEEPVTLVLIIREKETK